MAGRHSSGPDCGAAGEIPQDVWCAHRWDSCSYLGIHATGCSWRAAHSLGALIHVGERSEESAHTRHKTNAREEGCVFNTACAVSLCKGCVSLFPRRKPLTPPGLPGTESREGDI